MIRFAIPAWIASFAFLGSVSAQHVDILIARDASGTKLVTGSADLVNGNYTVGQQVFEAEFGEDPQLPQLASDPGFNAVANPTGGTALLGSTPLGFRFSAATIGSTTSNLFYWDGVGDVNFTAAPAGHAFTASRAGGFSASADGSAFDVAGFTIATTGSDGFVHRHLDFELSSTAGTPADGIYLLAPVFTMVGVADSDKTWFVFNHGLDEPEHEASVEWVELNLVPVPEPGCVLLFAAAAMVPVGRRFLRRSSVP
jgi:hypothetical protein